MALKLTLKPGEKLVVNGAVIENGDRRAVLVVKNRASILREKDIMQPAEANTPMRRIYFAAMMLYLDDGSQQRQYYDEFLLRITEFMNAITTPEAVQTCLTIIGHVNAREYYKALMACRKLFPFEEARLQYVAA
jgi:flagellar biosynthesis repressor protein FlbT